MDNGFKYDIKEFQAHILGLLDVMDKVCREHGLSYYMIAGTLLGAVRHKGFIPWDDDLDVGMFRKDYDLLLEHYREWLPERYTILSFESDKEYSRHFAKLVDRNTTLVDRFHLRRLSGVFMDIFPLDDVPDNKLLRHWHYRRFRTCEKLLYYAYRDPYKHGNGLSARLMVLFQKLSSREKLHARLHKILTEYDGKPHCSCCMAHGGFNPIPKDVYGTPVQYEFEKGSYMGPALPAEYLTCTFGSDYMQLPPVEKRETHGFHYCDYDHGYETANFDELKRRYEEYKKSETV